MYKTVLIKNLVNDMNAINLQHSVFSTLLFTLTSVVLVLPNIAKVNTSTFVVGCIMEYT